VDMEIPYPDGVLASDLNIKLDERQPR